MKILTCFRLSLLAAWISACSTPVELPKATETLRDLYRRAVPPAAPEPLPRPLPAKPLQDNPFLASLDAPLRRDFRVLPNPRLLLYVYPHLAADGSPVPGYATWFTVFANAPVQKVMR